VIDVALEMHLPIRSSGFEWRTVAFRPSRQQFRQFSHGILSVVICDSRGWLFPTANYGIDGRYEDRFLAFGGWVGSLIGGLVDCRVCYNDAGNGLFDESNRNTLAPGVSRGMILSNRSA
jgi:hypothetical protein